MKLIYLHQLVYMKLAYKTCCTEDKQKKNQVLPLNCTVYNRCMLYKIVFHEVNVVNVLNVNIDI